MKDKIIEEVNKKNKKEDNKYIVGLGRRKASVAGVRLYKEGNISWGESVINKGEIFVNKIQAAKYFGENAAKVYTQPLVISGTENKFSITVKVKGGGKEGQLDATVLAISRALDKFDKEKFHTLLKKKGFLSRDPRVRERRKVGMGGKSRRRKQSPKR